MAITRYQFAENPMLQRFHSCGFSNFPSFPMGSWQRSPFSLVAPRGKLTNLQQMTSSGCFEVRYYAIFMMTMMTMMMVMMMITIITIIIVIIIIAIIIIINSIMIVLRINNCFFY
jgi:hypothetical protein